MKQKIIRDCCSNRPLLCYFFIALFLSSIPVDVFSHKSILASTEAANTFTLIMGRIQDRHKAVNVSTTDNTYTKYYMSTLKTDGSFPDINYADKSQTNWAPLAHLDRMKYMVLSYTISTSKYYADESLYNQIVSMLNYWYDKHPTSTNWYNQQIACPQRMGVMLILMRSGVKHLPTAVENKLIERMKTEGGRPDQSGSQGTGANKLDIATHWIYRGCLTEDESVLAFGAQQVYYPLFLTTGEGLQHDYSYQQHGNQIHIGAYGFAFVDGISSIASYMTGTEYEMSKEKLDYLSRFVRDTYLPTIRGQYFMYNVVGRAVSRSGGLNQSGFHTVLTRLKGMDSEHSPEYDQAILRLKGTQPASYALQSFNRNLWRSDYMLHQRPSYTFDIRGASTYSCKNENGNKENLKGYFLSEGATELVLNGTEFVNIFSVWDWTRIPGTTTPVLTSIPLPAQWQNSGTSKFSGSASDEVFGVTAFVYNDPKYSINTQAKKSWFMFDDEIVCLGADITSTATQQINTTVNQVLLNGDVYVKDNGGISKKQAAGSSNYTNLSWIYHNNVGYFFPQKSNINVSNTTQSGAWSTINSSQSSTTESKNVFKVWFNHGVKPIKETYEYILLPNIDLSKMEAYKSDKIEVLYNNADIQAVKHKTLDILGIVFYKATTFKNGNVEVTVDKPCVVMFRNVSTSKVSAFISDPSRSNSDIRVVASFPSINEKKQLDCVLPKLKDPYAGATVSYIIDENTPTAVSEPNYDSLVVSEDAWVRDGAFSSQNIGGNTNTLTIKKDGSGYNREVYLKFDLSGIDTNAYERYLLKLSVTNSNTSISDTQWNISYISNDNWSENAITWDNSPAKDYLIKTVSAVSDPSDLIVDLTDIVTNEITKGNKILSLHMASTERGSDGKTDAQFYSKESSNSDNFPQLLLQLSENVQPADIVEIQTIADSWVRDGVEYENVNYGKTNNLTVKKDNVGYNREAYLKFNIDAVKQSKIRKVSLKLNVSNANTSIAQIHWGIKGTNSNWDEYAITNVNKPEIITDVIASQQGVSTGSDISFDITSFVKAQSTSGSNSISLLVYGIDKATDGKSDAQFFSKESDNSEKYPRLVFELEPKALVVCRSDLSSSATSVKQEEEFTVSTQLLNIGNSGFSGNMGIALVDSVDNILDLVGTSEINYSLPVVDNINNEGEVFISICKIPSSITPGQYKLRTVTKPIDSDWMVTYGYQTVVDSLLITVAEEYPIQTVWSPKNGSTDWRSKANWTEGVPGAKTEVIIPQSSSYPVLVDTVKVDIIHFKAGSELKRQDLLVYNKAFVEYDFGQSDRSTHFRMLSLPLMEAYPGDFTFAGKPDVYFQTLGIDSVGHTKWVSAKGGNNGVLSAGSGFVLSLKANDSSVVEGLDVSNGILQLPYFDSNWGVDSLVHSNHKYDGVKSTFSNPYGVGTYSVLRSSSAYRLAPTNVSVNPDFGKIGDGSVFALVGNPFMTTIDFDQFYTDNNSLIKNGYQVWAKVGTEEGYVGYTPDGCWGLETPIDNFIAPMQGFVVEQANPAVTSFITFNLNNITAIEKVNLRSNTLSKNKIDIVAANDSAKVRTFIANREDGSLFLGECDTRKLLTDLNAVPEIYTLKRSGNQMVSVGANITHGDDIEYPIGIATTLSGDITFTFTGMDSYDATVLFTDKVLNKTINLTGLNEFEYSFKYVVPSNAQGLMSTDNRFSIRTISQTSSIDDNRLHQELPLIIYASQGVINIASTDSNWIKGVTIYSLNGVTVYQAEVNAASHSTTRSFTPGVYIVRVNTNVGIEHKKVIVK